VPGQPFSNPPQDRQLNPSNPVTPGATPGAPFAGTPLRGCAPPMCSAISCFPAQIALARRGFLSRWRSTVCDQPAVESSLCAHIKRGRGSRYRPVRLWKRLPRSNYCRGHVHRSLIRPVASVRDPSRQCTANGFLNRHRPWNIDGIAVTPALRFCAIETDRL
jgi:hypothetical protein